MEVNAHHANKLFTMEKKIYAVDSKVIGNNKRRLLVKNSETFLRVPE
jgi:hypothetical protein